MADARCDDEWLDKTLESLSNYASGPNPTGFFGFGNNTPSLPPMSHQFDGLSSFNPIPGPTYDKLSVAGYPPMPPMQTSYPPPRDPYDYSQHKVDALALKNNQFTLSTHATPGNYIPMSSEIYSPPVSHWDNYPAKPMSSYNNGSTPSYSEPLPRNLLDNFIFESKPTVQPTINKKKISPGSKKQKSSRPVRPKVISENGAIQCIGTNIKKKRQCKNAALMEYIGTRPVYCAEHIELDPNTLYQKCLSDYGKEPGDKKKCKEIVLKEFGFCYKHFDAHIATYPPGRAGIEKAKAELKRVSDLLATLEFEAKSVKRQKHDLFQRKNKLIPKFAKMKSILEKFIEENEDVQFESNESSPQLPDLFAGSNQTSGEWDNFFSNVESDNTL